MNDWSNFLDISVFGAVVNLVEHFNEDFDDRRDDFVESELDFCAVISLSDSVSMLSSETMLISGPFCFVDSFCFCDFVEFVVLLFIGLLNLNESELLLKSVTLSVVLWFGLLFLFSETSEMREWLFLMPEARDGFLLALELLREWVSDFVDDFSRD